MNTTRIQTLPIREQFQQQVHEAEAIFTDCTGKYLIPLDKC